MPATSSESGNRSLLAFAATATVLGIGLSVAGSSALAAWLTVSALALLVFALHRFGRSGPDAPLILDERDRN